MKRLLTALALVATAATPALSYSTCDLEWEPHKGYLTPVLLSPEDAEAALDGKPWRIYAAVDTASAKEFWEDSIFLALANGNRLCPLSRTVLSQLLADHYKRLAVKSQ